MKSDILFKLTCPSSDMVYVVRSLVDKNRLKATDHQFRSENHKICNCQQKGFAMHEHFHFLGNILA